MHLTLSEKAHYASYLAAGVKVLVRGRELTLADVEFDADDFKSIIPSAPAPTSAPTPKDFASALAAELKAGKPVADAIRSAATAYPQLYAEYCRLLTDPSPATPGPDATPAARSHGTDRAGTELARHMAAGGECRPGAPGYAEWIASFADPTR